MLILFERQTDKETAFGGSLSKCAGAGISVLLCHLVGRYSNISHYCASQCVHQLEAATLAWIQTLPPTWHADFPHVFLTTDAYSLINILTIIVHETTKLNIWLKNFSLVVLFNHNLLIFQCEWNNEHWNYYEEFLNFNIG